MADDEVRRPRGRRGRRPGREPVPADTSGSRDFNPGDSGDSGDDGSAGVREPRRPKPSGPVSGAGMRPEPEPPLTALLPDPRY